VDASDDLEIRTVLARLAHLADTGDLDDYVALFTDDAVWEMTGASRRGHADIRAGAEARRAEGVTGPGSNTRHVIATIAVRGDGDGAVSDSSFLFFVDTTTAPRLQGVGVYRDHFVRTPAGWKLARRQITMG
jgi:uncharacterized protein (TIGR02246 family)